MLIVKSVGIPTILSAINVQGFIGCGNNKTIVVKSIVRWAHFREDHQLGEDSSSKHQLPTIQQVASTGNASFVMLIVYGARIPQANVSGARITRLCWIYRPNAKLDSHAQNATTIHWMGVIMMITIAALTHVQLTFIFKSSEGQVLSWG